jgi:hypothetical protein
MLTTETWSRGHATPEAIAWAMDLSEGERLKALMTLAHLEWTADEQAKFAAIWIVIADRRALAFAAAGGAPTLKVRAEQPSRDCSFSLNDALELPSDELHGELESFVGHYRTGTHFSDEATERLGILWAALNIREGIGAHA